jgi:S-adenosylmethionine:tRNA ribosyltransferase-isomerase
LKSADFDFHLPNDLIAQAPVPSRSDSRMLVYERASDSITHAGFKDITSYLEEGDLLVMNDTRVMQARLFGKKATGGKLELLVERVLNEASFAAHIKASKALKPGQIFIIDDEIKLEMTRREGDLFICRILGDWTVHRLLEEKGVLPLPSYIERQTNENDSDRYQTVYAKKLGAVAAPTAGLHFNDMVLTKLKEKGVKIVFLTLHVGAGTFQPVRVDDVEEHVMHSEWLTINKDVVSVIKETKAQKKRVIAIGTTVVRSLETAGQTGVLTPFEGETSIFIYPGYQFKVIDGMLTNFHLPKSTLLMLVCAFLGKEKTLALYETAVLNAYRFFSYGDTSLFI